MLAERFELLFKHPNEPTDVRVDHIAAVHGRAARVARRGGVRDNGPHARVVVRLRRERRPATCCGETRPKLVKRPPKATPKKNTRGNTRRAQRDQGSA